MEVNLPPVPFKAQMIGDNGFLTAIWADWFKKMQARVGGNISSSLDDIGDLFPVQTANITDDAVTAAKLADHASTDASRAVTTNHIRDSAVTTAKINNEAVSFAKLLSTDWLLTFDTSGYQELPTGLLIQWGVTGSLLTATTNGISFPTSFPVACRQVLACPQGNSGSSTAATGHWGTGNYSTTGFDLYNRTTISLTFNYIAIGN